MRFWDTSALVPLLVEEPSTPAMLAAYRSDPVVLVAWTTAVECASAIGRAEREGMLGTSTASTAFARLDELLHLSREVGPSTDLQNVARRLLRVHPLRSADAIQLASAVIAAEHKPVTLPFVTLDVKLSSVASKEGFPVMDYP